MSLYKDASLVMIPSAYKDGKLYSIRPTDGSGDFTFSRGSNLSATRVGPTGLIEKGRENLFLQSNQFDTTWLQNRIDLTSGQSGYDGGSNAWKLESNDASTTYLSQSVSASGVQTTSLYAKAGTADYFAYYTSSGVSAWFNLSNGSIENTGSNIDTQIEDVGNGWYRCSMSYNASISYVRIYLTDVNGSFISAVGSNIYIQDAQLEIGLAATEVITTGATTGKAGLLEDEPRFDYSGGATCPSLLLEPSRTNLVSYSEYFNSSYWAKSGSSITSNAVISPDGGLNASKLVEGTNNGVHRLRKASLLTGNTEYTISVFAKAGERTWLNISENQVGESWFDLGNGVTGASSATASGMIAFANGWYICWQTSTPTSTGNVDLYTATDGSTKVYQGDGTSGIYIYGAQAEQASYPTSYIPNHSGGSVTRGADVCSVTGVSSLIGQTEGTMFFEIDQPYADGVKGAWSISDGSSTNRLTMNTLDVNTTTFTFGIATNYAGGSTKLASVNKTYGLHKVAIQYSGTTLKLFVDGALADSATTDGFGNFTNFYVGANQIGVGDEIREFKQAVLFPTALTDSECIALTSI